MTNLLSSIETDNLKKIVEKYSLMQKKLYYQHANKQIPFIIKRNNDNDVLFLNNDFYSYSFANHKKSTWYKYTIDDIESYGDLFSVLNYKSLIELINNPKKYFSLPQQKIFNNRIIL